MNFKEPIKNGFSIIELIIAGVISITAISVGFSLLQIALKGNKIDETQMGLNGRINDTLDFILDEVKASKRIIEDEAEITQFNQNCTFPNNSEFLFGIFSSRRDIFINLFCSISSISYRPNYK